MSRLIGLYTLILCMTCVRAQDFNTHWIAYPEPDSTSEVWFRQDYNIAEHPAQASVTVVSTGNFELYVNGKNVSTDVLIPYRAVNSDNPIAVTYDVTRFLAAGVNTIAVWYSPSYPHLNARQVSVSYYGRTSDGQHFTYNSNGNWLCRKANFSLNSNGSESVNGNVPPLRWNSEEVDVACWQSAMVVKSGRSEPIIRLSSFYNAMKVGKIQQPTNRYAEGDSVYYALFKPFIGYIRITLRGAKKGERIDICGLKYVCNGTTDEQAYAKFTVGAYHKLIIRGDKNFNPTQIQKIEGIEIVPYAHRNYIY